ncbi:MAG: hypothetical protein LBH20_11250 [Treponema sp.]|jgi:hypothetical protein|nr:hypothetical protein [Treponema sp.]
MKTATVSAFMLEKYRLGELSPQDQKMVEEALAVDGGLKDRLKELDESDRELRLRYLSESFRQRLQTQPQHFVRARTVMRLTGLAALIVAGILVPVLYVVFVRNDSAISSGTLVASVPANRIKGTAQTASELLIYVKGEEVFLPNQTALQEGDTVQLAYTAPAETEHYGVIFSIDGRSAVTMHYPYRKGQSSLLVSGKRTFLNEAYTLDDAPGYEVFVLVVSEEPLDTDTVLRKAQRIAGESKIVIEEKSKAAFEDCEVETITILKKN